MGRGRKIKAFCCLLAVIVLLCGCNGTDVPGGNESNGDVQQGSGTVTVYAEQRYKAALQQVFSHINLSEDTLELCWTGDMAAADVVITDHLAPESYRDYRVLETEDLAVQPMEQLLLRDDRGVIGLPLFLRIDGFWYDELLYENTGVTVPQSLDTWKVCTLNSQYPAVCDESEMNALFWGAVAPLYLRAGGTSAELSSGVLQQESLLTALNQLKKLQEDGLLKLTNEARQSFTSTQAAFWAAGVDRVAESYNFMSNLSTWLPTFSLLFPAQERALCVLRADFLVIRETADHTLTNRFLNLFFEHQALADLSEDAKMPMACQMSYAPSTVPELPQTCYTVLSSPTVDLAYVNCCWSSDRQETVYEALLSLMQGSIDTTQAAQQILQ